MDIADLQKWAGKTESASDQITAKPIAMLSATLDIEVPHPLVGDPVPPLWHWLYFLEAHKQSELSPDGHAKLGGFLPPVPLPRRMWAGGRFEFHRPLRVGETFTRTSRIAGVQEKFSRSQFELMIRRDFSPMTEAEHVEFGAVRVDGAAAAVQVFLTAPDGAMRGFLYSFTAEADGWKIDGVQPLGPQPLRRLPGLRI